MASHSVGHIPGKQSEQSSHDALETPLTQSSGAALQARSTAERKLQHVFVGPAAERVIANLLRSVRGADDQVLWDPSDLDSDMRILVDLLHEELGFLRHDAEQAVLATVEADSTANASLARALDWLVIRIDEQDLPPRFQSLSAQVTFLQGGGGEITEDAAVEMVRELSIATLLEYGFTRPDCERALHETGNIERDALLLLCRLVLKKGGCSLPSEQDIATCNRDMMIESWSDEFEALEAIYGDDCVDRQSNIHRDATIRFHITIKKRDSSNGTGGDHGTLHILHDPHWCYPFAPPLVLFTHDALQPWERLEVVKRLVSEVIAPHAGNLEMEASILYQIGMWLEEQVVDLASWDIQAPPEVAEASDMSAIVRGPGKVTTKRIAKKECVSTETGARDGPATAAGPHRHHSRADDEEQVPPEIDTAAALSYPAQQVDARPEDAVDALSSLMKPRGNGGRKIGPDMFIASKDPVQKESARLKSDLLRKSKDNKTYKQMQAVRGKLPAAAQREQVLELVRNNQTIVLCGETGCGKTTQIPQFILDDLIMQGRGAECRIICTQPRRISAIAVADRVSSERAENTGQTVGYQIRLEAKRSRSTRLLFCTIGVLLRRLIGDPDLKGTSHIIVDEVHERSIDSDFLLIILRDLLARRPDLKCILMSATINADLFSKYFHGAPVITIPGFTHPVSEHYLADIYEETGYILEPGSPFAKSLDKRVNSGKGTGGYWGQAMKNMDRGALEEAMMMNEEAELQEQITELAELYPDYSNGTLGSLARTDEDQINIELIVELVRYINNTYDQGAVLIFMPGLQEITSVIEAFEDANTSGGKYELRVIGLHSSLSSEMQRSIFERPPPGVRKVIVSTNIAETSITVDDVVYVIDTGRHKETRYDPWSHMPQLKQVWVSKANAKQRRGRAGRVQAGHCFFLYTEERHAKLAANQLPEMLRAPLEELCLQIKLLGYGDPRVFLSKAIQPPHPQTLARSMELLADLDAITAQDEELTALGEHLATLPVSLRVGKMMIYGSIFRCLDPVLTIAACMTFKSPFVSPITKRDEAQLAKMKFRLGQSDHLTVLKAYRDWTRAKQEKRDRKFCFDNYLSREALVMISNLKRQFFQMLTQIGFADKGRAAAKSHIKRDVGELLGGPYYNANAGSVKLIKAVLCGGLVPNVVRVLPPKKTVKENEPPRLATQPDGGGEVFLHPGSVLYKDTSFPSGWLVYHEKVKTSKVYIRDATMVTPYALIMFAGQVVVDHDAFTISVNQWIQFSMATVRSAVLLKELRNTLNELLRRKINEPALDITLAGETIAAIVKLVESERHYDLDEVVHHSLPNNDPR